MGQNGKSLRISKKNKPHLQAVTQMTFATKRVSRMRTVWMLATATFVSQATANTDVSKTLPSFSAESIYIFIIINYLFNN